MLNAIISFKNLASDKLNEKSEQLLKILNDKSLFVSCIENLPNDFSDALKFSIISKNKVFDNIFVITEDSLKFSIKEVFSKLDIFSDNDLIYKKDACRIFVLPNNFELGLNLVKENLIPLIYLSVGDVYNKEIIKVFSLDKNLVENVIAEARQIAKNSVDIYYTENFGDYKIEIVFNKLSPKIIIDDIIRKITSCLFENIYSLDDIDLPHALYNLCRLRKITLSTAESFTGGGITKSLINVSGISEIFDEGIVSYSNSAKKARLNVSQSTLNEYGAVSDETAYQMALGLLSEKRCNACITTTGIAGPKSDSANAPIGLCYIGIGLQNEIEVFKFHFSGDRNAITNTAINAAMYLAYKKIRN